MPRTDLIQVSLGVIIQPPGNVLVTTFTDEVAKKLGIKHAGPGGEMIAADNGNPRRTLYREIHYQTGLHIFVGELIAQTQRDTKVGREQISYFLCFPDTTIFDLDAVNPEPKKYEAQTWVPIQDLDKYPPALIHPTVRERLNGMLYSQ
jgi:hypothetical protein